MEEQADSVFSMIPDEILCLIFRSLGNSDRLTCRFVNKRCNSLLTTRGLVKYQNEAAITINCWNGHETVTYQGPHYYWKSTFWRSFECYQESDKATYYTKFPLSGLTKPIAHKIDRQLLVATTDYEKAQDNLEAILKCIPKEIPLYITVIFGEDGRIMQSMICNALKVHPNISCAKLFPEQLIYYQQLLATYQEYGCEEFDIEDFTDDMDWIDMLPTPNIRNYFNGSRQLNAIDTFLQEWKRGRFNVVHAEFDRIHADEEFFINWGASFSDDILSVQRNCDKNTLIICVEDLKVTITEFGSNGDNLIS